MRVFDGDGADYTFATSHVALSGTHVQVRFEQGMWVLTQQEGSSTWTARSQSKTGAVLLLIAARMGLRIDEDFKDVEEEGEPT